MLLIALMNCLSRILDVYCRDARLDNAGEAFG